MMSSLAGSSSYVDPKNRPILLVSALCSAILLSAGFFSFCLWLELAKMSNQLEEAAEQFKSLTDQSWELLFRDSQHRSKRQFSSYFDSLERSSAPSTGGGTCRCAPSASNCPAGPAGQAGEKGEPGVPGKDGPPGKQGEVGGIFVYEEVKPPCVSCPAGSPGPKGRPGQPGRPGSDGLTGQNGRPGKNSEPGRMGPQGESGPAGPAGKLGDPGPPGESVSTWARVGTTGAKGEPGLAGESGEEGPPGQDGLPGSIGIPGPIGLAGPRGDPGVAGIPGERGSPGKEGAEKNYCPCPPRSEQPPAVISTGGSGGYQQQFQIAKRRGVRTGDVKLGNRGGKLANAK